MGFWDRKLFSENTFSSLTNALVLLMFPVQLLKIFHATLGFTFDVAQDLVRYYSNLPLETGQDAANRLTAGIKTTDIECLIRLAHT